MYARRRRRVSSFLGDASVGVLESRVLLSGNVTVALDGLDLVITGDKSSNSVQVLFDGVNVVVRGLDGTSINGGAADFVAAAATNTLPGNVGVSLLKGNDLFYMSDGVTVTNSVVIEPGAGNDSTVIVDATVTEDIIVGIPFLETNDAGNDRVAVLTSTAANVTVSLGAGHDIALLGDVVVSENIVLLMGAGNDAVAGDMTAIENVIVGMGSGNDLMIGNVTGGGIGIDMEAGNDVLHLIGVDQNDPARLAQINLGTGNDKATIGLGSTVSFASTLHVTGSTGTDKFFLFPGATLSDGLLILDVESTAPYIAILDPAIEKQLASTFKRFEDFELFLTSLP